MAIKKSVIDTVKVKISGRIKELEIQLPEPVEISVRDAVFKALGLDKLEPKLAAARKKKQEAAAEYNKIKERVERVVGGGSIYSYDSGHKSLSEVLDYYCGANYSIWSKALEKERTKQLANHPAMQEIQKLKKLRDNLELRLELAASTKEVREALQEVLAQIGEEGE